MPEMTFSEILKKLRKSKGLTQEQVAERLGVSPQAVSKWENGSYPDGDLIPKVARLYGVSVSYLYGEEGEAKSPEQLTFEYLKEVFQGSAADESGKKGRSFFDRVLNMAWAAHTSPWLNCGAYYPRPVFDKNSRTVAVYTNESGFEFMSLNKDREFYTVLPEPENGFIEWAGDRENMRKFFAIMGEEGTLEIVLFMLSLTPGEFVSAATVSETIGVKEDVAAHVLETFASASQWNGCIRRICALNTKDEHEMMYGTVSPVAGLLLNIFAEACMIMDPPDQYQMQIVNRGRSWIDRDKLLKMLK